jgi:hypothetical protein
MGIESDATIGVTQFHQIAITTRIPTRGDYFTGSPPPQLVYPLDRRYRCRNEVCPSAEPKPEVNTPLVGGYKPVKIGVGLGKCSSGLARGGREGSTVSPTGIRRRSLYSSTLVGAEPIICGGCFG